MNPMPEITDPNRPFGKPPLAVFVRMRRLAGSPNCGESVVNQHDTGPARGWGPPKTPGEDPVLWEERVIEYRPLDSTRADGVREGLEMAADRLHELAIEMHEPAISVACDRVRALKEQSRG